MKTLEQRAEILVGWNTAIEESIIRPFDDGVEPHWQGREPGLKKLAVGALSAGDYALRAIKIATIMPIVMYAGLAFDHSAERAGYDVDANGPLNLAEEIIAKNSK